MVRTYVGLGAAPASSRPFGVPVIGQFGPLFYAAALSFFLGTGLIGLSALLVILDHEARVRGPF